MGGQLIFPDRSLTQPWGTGCAWTCEAAIIANIATTRDPTRNICMSMLSSAPRWHRLFDYLVCSKQDRLRNSDTKLARCLHIDPEFVCAERHDRHVPGVGSSEDAL